MQRVRDHLLVVYSAAWQTLHRASHHRRVPHTEPRKEPDVMTHLYYEVDVPIRSAQTPGHDGVHVFTGQADSRGAAVKAAREVYESTRAAIEAGLEVPRRRPDGWAALGYRAGWELDWTAATVGPWRSPHNWADVKAFEM
jgi:hypothetical protein